MSKWIQISSYDMLVIGVPLIKDGYVSNCGRKCKVKMSRPDLFMKQTTKLSSYLPGTYGWKTIT